MKTYDFSLSPPFLLDAACAADYEGLPPHSHRLTCRSAGGLKVAEHGIWVPALQY